jgi:hypothetical protein
MRIKKGDLVMFKWWTNRTDLIVSKGPIMGPKGHSVPPEWKLDILIVTKVRSHEASKTSSSKQRWESCSVRVTNPRLGETLWFKMHQLEVVREEG